MLRHTLPNQGGKHNQDFRNALPLSQTFGTLIAFIQCISNSGYWFVDGQQVIESDGKHRILLVALLQI